MEIAIMSLDRLKKRAKNVQDLLEEFGVASPVKLSIAQKFVAREDGYPNWEAVCAAQGNTEPPPKKSRPAAPDYWVLRYSEFADVDDPVVEDIRIIEGVTDATVMMWVSFTNFDDRQEYPGRPQDFTLTLEPCDQPGAATDQCMRLKYAGAHRRLEIDLYPLAEAVMMLDRPYRGKVDPAILAALQKRTGLSDLRAVLAAAQIVYEEMKTKLIAYHQDHPGKEVSQDLEGFMKEELRKKAEARGQRAGIWPCEISRVGRWRFSLLFLPESDEFNFDAFDEAGRTGSLTCESEKAVIKREPSGQWAAAARNSETETVALTDITDVALESLDALAADWGIELSIDGVRKRASAPNGSAPAQARFLEWLRKEKPEVLAGGKFA